MPRICTICNHPDRAKIDELLVIGTSLRIVAKQLGLSPASVFRHKTHISASLVEARDAGEVARADELLDKVQSLLNQTADLYADARRIQRDAERDKDKRLALHAIREAVMVAREARGVLELLARLSGQLEDRQRIRVEAQFETYNLSLLSDAELELVEAGDFTPIQQAKKPALPLAP